MYVNLTFLCSDIQLTSYEYRLHFYRTDNAIKNRWHATLKKQNKSLRKSPAKTTLSSASGSFASGVQTGAMVSNKKFVQHQVAAQTPAIATPAAEARQITNNESKKTDRKIRRRVSPSISPSARTVESMASVAFIPIVESDNVAITNPEIPMSPLLMHGAGGGGSARQLDLSVPFSPVSSRSSLRKGGETTDLVMPKLVVAYHEDGRAEGGIYSPSKYLARGVRGASPCILRFCIIFMRFSPTLSRLACSIYLPRTPFLMDIVRRLSFIDDDETLSSYVDADIAMLAEDLK